MARRAVLSFVVASLLLAAACAPDQGQAGLAGPSIASSYDWWFAGDSGFAGVGDYDLGAPSKLRGVQSIAVAAHVLADVEILGNKQPLVLNQIRHAVSRYGGVLPGNVVIHAGGADLLARAMELPQLPLIEDYTEAVRAIDDLYRSQGVEVWWTSVLPFTTWGLAGSQVNFRLQLNAAIAEAVGPERFIDCDPVMTEASGRWLKTEFALSIIDGAHLNAAGAVEHARCMATFINDTLGRDALTLR